MIVWSLTTDTDAGLFTSLYLTEGAACQALVDMWFPFAPEAENVAQKWRNRKWRASVLPLVGHGSELLLSWFGGFLEEEGKGNRVSIEMHDHPWAFENADLVLVPRTAMDL